MKYMSRHVLEKKCVAGTTGMGCCVISRPYCRHSAAMLEKWAIIWSLGLWLIFRRTYISPCFFSWSSMVLATTSLGANYARSSYSGRNLSIDWLKRIPPSPLTASVMRNAFSLLLLGFIGRPSSDNAVGWNWTNLALQSRDVLLYEAHIKRAEGAKLT
jgi:hypothetical protein